MDVIEELTETDKVDRSYVERRLDDWRRRLDALYRDIEKLASDRLVNAPGAEVSIDEELMQRLVVPEQHLPARILVRDGESIGHLEPRGLWIIGANGRVDLVLPDAHYLIVDRTDSFEPSNWQIASIDARREQTSLTREVVQEILR